MTTLAFECFADRDVFHFVRDHLTLSLRGLHSGTESRVVKDVFESLRADVGMVDEDPMSTHHPLRDRMAQVCSGVDLDIRGAKNRFLFVIKPNLEDCFFNAADRVGHKPRLAKSADELHQLLGPESSKKHRDFVGELNELHELARTKKVKTFTTEIEDALRRVVGGKPPA